MAAVALVACVVGIASWWWARRAPAPTSVRSDVLELEGDVARSVASEIRGKIGDAHWAGRRGDLLVDSEAHEAYLKGALVMAATEASSP